MSEEWRILPGRRTSIAFIILSEKKHTFVIILNQTRYDW
jgi:hypothetical protein